MTPNIAITTQSTTEPVTLAQAKEWLLIDGSDQDSIITGLIQVAREIVEHESGIVGVKRTYTEYFDAWPTGRRLALTATPLISVASIEYVANGASAETYTTLSDSAYYLDKGATPGEVVLKDGQTWPGLASEQKAVKVVYVAGHEYGALPARFVQAMRMQIGALYENREDQAVSTANGRTASVLATKMRAIWV